MKKYVNLDHVFESSSAFAEKKFEPVVVLPPQKNFGYSLQLYSLLVLGGKVRFCKVSVGIFLIAPCKSN